MARNSVGLLSSFRRSIEVSTLRCTGCQRPNSQRRPLHLPTSWTTPRSPSPLPKEYSLRPALLWIRHASTSQSSTNIHAARQQVYASRNRSLLMYTLAVIFLGVGVTYAAVPLYRVFCSATGFAGTPLTDKTKFSADRLIPDASSERVLRIGFNADASDALPWAFSPQQKEVYVKPGETALAFYKAKNRSDKDIIGIATYNVTPDKVSLPFLSRRPSISCLVTPGSYPLGGSVLCKGGMFLLRRAKTTGERRSGPSRFLLHRPRFRGRPSDEGRPGHRPVIHFLVSVRGAV
jgi:cytochrome c oxidase assembly protein Cox11